jgi:WD40 repeat protein
MSKMIATSDSDEGCAEIIATEQTADNTEDHTSRHYTAISFRSGFVKVSDSHSRKVVAKLMHDHPVIGCWIDPTNRRLASSAIPAEKRNEQRGTAEVLVWDLNTFDQICKLDEEEYWHYVQFSSDGAMLITLTSMKEDLIVWDIIAGSKLYRIDYCGIGSACTLCFRSDLNRILYAYEVSQICILDASHGAHIGDFGAERASVMDLRSWHGGSSNCVAWDRSDFTVYDMLTGEERNSFHPGKLKFHELLQGSSENIIIGSHEEFMSVWDVYAGTLLLRFTPTFKATAFALNSANNTIIMLNPINNYITVHDASSGKQLGCNMSNKIVPYRVACSPAPTLLL